MSRFGPGLILGVLSGPVPQLLLLSRSPKIGYGALGEIGGGGRLISWSSSIGMRSGAPLAITSAATKTPFLSEAVTRPQL